MWQSPRYSRITDAAHHSRPVSSDGFSSEAWAAASGLPAKVESIDDGHEVLGDSTRGGFVGGGRRESAQSRARSSRALRMSSREASDQASGSARRTMVGAKPWNVAMTSSGDGVPSAAEREAK